MNRLQLATVLLPLATALLPVCSYAFEKSISQTPATLDTSHPHLNDNDTQGDRAQSLPLISVGVSDPNTKLNLPWFLTDVIDTVNMRKSPSDLLHAVRNDF